MGMRYMSEEIRRRILEEAPWSKIERIDALLKRFVEEVEKEAVVNLLKLPIYELKAIVSNYGTEMEEKLESRMKENLKELFEMMKKRINRLSALIDEYIEKLPSFVFPTDDDKRIHEIYGTLPSELREKRPIVMEIPDFEELSPYPSDMKTSVLHDEVALARKKMAEAGGFVSIDLLEEKTGLPSQEIDRALKNAGFLRQSKKLLNGKEVTAYKLPVDEIWLRERLEKIKEEVEIEKEQIDKRKKEMLEQQREFHRY
jgi:hypothetical protein